MPEIKAQKTNYNEQYTEIIKRGCVWKNMLPFDNVLGIITQNTDNPLESVAKNRHCVIVNTAQPLNLEVLNIQKPWVRRPDRGRDGCFGKEGRF